MLITFNQSSELFACIVGAIAFSKLDFFTKLIAIQVFIALIIELIGLQIRIRHNSNIWLYNCYMPLEFSLLFIAIVHGQNKKFYTIILIILLLYLTIWIWEVFDNSIEIFAVKTYVLGAFILLVSYCFVLYKTALSRISLFHQSLFWFAIGIILFYGCNIPFFTMHNYIANNSSPAQTNMLLSLMTVFANVRYLCMAIGFIIIFKEKRRGNLKYGE